MKSLKYMRHFLLKTVSKIKRGTLVHLDISFLFPFNATVENCSFWFAIATSMVTRGQQGSIFVLLFKAI
jgi:hypothetical protein